MWSGHAFCRRKKIAFRQHACRAPTIARRCAREQRSSPCHEPHARKCADKGYRAAVFIPPLRHSRPAGECAPATSTAKKTKSRALLAKKRVCTKRARGAKQRAQHRRDVYNLTNSLKHQEPATHPRHREKTHADERRGHLVATITLSLFSRATREPPPRRSARISIGKLSA